MHAAVVITGVEVVAHMADLGILAERRVVVRGPRCRHVAQATRLDPGHEDALTDQPVGLVGTLTQDPLLHAGREHVRE